MKEIRVPSPGERPSAQTIKDIINEVKRTSKISVGPGLNLITNSTGTMISLTNSQSNSYATSTGITSGCLELLDEFDSSIYYNIGDRVAFAPSGSDYMYVYTCSVSGNTSSPSGTGFTLTTEYTTAATWASGTTYSNGNIVKVLQSPYYTVVYTCDGTALSGVSPPASGWTYTGYVNYAIKEFPPKYNDIEYKVPFKIRRLNTGRYNPISHQLLNYYEETSHDSLGKVFKVEIVKEEMNSQAVVHT